jgi:hypothetical protein
MRAWIVGNGPSLNKLPLDRLENEVTFGVNRIHLLYHRTTWRPTHWVLADRSKAPFYVDDILLHVNMREDCWVRQDFYDDMVAKKGEVFGNVHLYPNCTHVDASRNPSPGWHEPEYCIFGGSVPTAIQIAARLGYNDLYVIGCDLGYKGNEVNHFDPEYMPVDNRKVQQARLQNQTLQMAHELAYRECRLRGIRIYNAGVGGELTAYPRVDFEDVLSDSKTGRD